MAKRLNILLVDDDLSVRQSLAHALASENFHVVSVAGSQDAIRSAGETPIDVVLLDLNLGDESGWDTYEQLKRLRPLLTFVLMSARIDPTAPAQHEGVRAFLEKPLDLPLLFQTLDQLAAGNQPLTT
jgi:DNA-binding NtrC family response regulator